MKILFLNHNPPGVGTYHRCFFLGKYLSRLGNDVTLICKSEKKMDFHSFISNINDNMHVITLPRAEFKEYNDGHIFRTLLGSIKSLTMDYDLVHCFAAAQPTTAIPALLSKKLRNKKLFVDWDDPWGGGFAEYHGFVTRYVLGTLEKNIPKIADGVTVVSKVLEESAINLGIDKKIIHRLPNGANVDEIKPIPKEYCRKVLGLGKHEHIVLSLGHTYMGTLKLLLGAWEIVVKQMPSAKLLIVGNVRIPEELSDIYNKISNNIVLTGVQQYEKIPLYLSASNAVVLPMIDNLIEQARFPIRFGDYLAAGVPIVSNAVGEIKRVLKEDNCGLISDPNNIDELAENIITILKDKQMQEALGKRARETAERKYAWSMLAEKLNIIYKEACS